MKYTFYEFFAGGGMARLGLGDRWECVFSNEWSEKKASIYRANFGSSPELKVMDIALLSKDDLPRKVDLSWASFPCQDLSLAGMGAGLKGHRSGTFHHYWKHMDDLCTENRGPHICVLENVVGAITSHDGRDFETILEMMIDSGYLVGALVIDAKYFVPQSRPRLFVVGVKTCLRNIVDHILDAPDGRWHSKNILEANKKFSDKIKKSWVWWKLPKERNDVVDLKNIIEDDPVDVKWHNEYETNRLVSMMSEANAIKLKEAMLLNKKVVGTGYRRTRVDSEGNRVQRLEVRFDGIAGCLRTPAGGSSRQILIVVNGSIIKSRLLSGREVSRLMGVPDNYILPDKYNETYHLFGDGLVVPVVSFLEKNLLSHLVNSDG